MKKRVLVAMSGGVDSSVSALLLKNQGYDVVGVTMCLGVKDACDSIARCCGPDAIEDARQVCYKLNMDHYVLNYARELESRVISNFVDEYRRGRTPNPCVVCNQFLKFDLLMKQARALHFDYLATGHYAAISQSAGRYFLIKAKDHIKDQTYFLYSIPYRVLSRVLFPLSHLTKPEVRDIARKAKLPVSGKPESQDICFIPGKNYHAFLEKRLGTVEPGEIVNVQGRVLGKHRGICFYTIGQRQGLGLTHPKPLYVIALDAKQNQVIVGEKADLKSRGLYASHLNLLTDSLPARGRVKIRYGSTSSLASLFPEKNKLKILFDTKQEAVTPGQSAVIYNRDTVLGGGIIDAVIH
ncbi:MAG: tRNA 2-thiouridine(34) synthase MnmA [Candidatus Omnitrophica bacterium]|nr:tRNA 2-thiouridine(34) synthase MnmA [Candidatus Omnitrophota bacterium]